MIGPRPFQRKPPDGTKILDFLSKVRAPNPPGQIAAHIHETREDTLQAIERLEKKRAIKPAENFTFLKLTGETTSYYECQGRASRLPQPCQRVKPYFCPTKKKGHDNCAKEWLLNKGLRRSSETVY